MRVSDTRILTTHTGSLPRPPALVELYVRKAAGEAVDAELAEAGHAAMEEVVRKQRDAGIDIGNNGEQQREAFFLYVRGRMSGFGGSWDRPPRGDVDRYPLFKAAMARDIERQVWVSAREGLPTAIGDMQYLDRAAVEQECADFRGTLDRMATTVRRAVHDRAVAGHRRGGDAQRLLSEPGRPISRRWATRYRWNTKPSCGTGSCCNWIVRIWRWSGTTPGTRSRWTNS